MTVVPEMTSGRRLHFAWVVLGAFALCMLAATGLRSTFGVYIRPMEQEFGWSRGALSGPAALSLLLLGAVGPWVGRLADVWGPRRVVTVGLSLMALATIATGWVHSLWAVYLFAGILTPVGAGALGVSTSATVAARWFESRRGLVLGILGAGQSAGQLLVIPLATALTLAIGWRQSFVYLGAALGVLVLPLALWLVRNDPADLGLRPYGAVGPRAAAATMATAQSGGRVSIAEAAGVPAFWLLMITFFICGYTTSGMILTHFIPHSADHGFAPMTAAQALGVMGAMNIIGTIASGWFCDRVGRRGPLAVYYLVRGLSLIFLIYVWNVPTLHLWAAIFGLNFISTVPPTTTLTANIFGRYSVGELSGWIFFSHQVGAALGAALAGWIYEWSGSYDPAFISAALLAFLAAGLTLAIREEPVRPAPTPASAALPTPAGS
jgi:MFS family permease